MRRRKNLLRKFKNAGAFLNLASTKLYRLKNNLSRTLLCALSTSGTFAVINFCDVVLNSDRICFTDTSYNRYILRSILLLLLYQILWSCIVLYEELHMEQARLKISDKLPHIYRRQHIFLYQLQQRH